MEDGLTACQMSKFGDGHEWLNLIKLFFFLQLCGENENKKIHKKYDLKFSTKILIHFLYALKDLGVLGLKRACAKTRKIYVLTRCHVSSSFFVNFRTGKN